MQTMVTIPEKSKFAHRANSDGTFDSICRKCFLTVVSSKSEADLEGAEREHVCDPFQLAELTRMGEK
jgi:hypothetical protein